MISTWYMYIFWQISILLFWFRLITCIVLLFFFIYNSADFAFIVRRNYAEVFPNFAKVFSKISKSEKKFLEFACLAIFLHIWILQKIVIKQLKNVINIGALRLASVLSFLITFFLNCLTNSWNPDPVPHPHPSTSCLITKQAVVHWYIPMDSVIFGRRSPGYASGFAGPFPSATCSPSASGSPPPPTWATVRRSQSTSYTFPCPISV